MGKAGKLFSQGGVSVDVPWKLICPVHSSSDSKGVKQTWGTVHVSEEAEMTEVPAFLCFGFLTCDYDLQVG